MFNEAVFSRSFCVRFLLRIAIDIYLEIELLDLEIKKAGSHHFRNRESELSFFYPSHLQYRQSVLPMRTMPQA
jgi:hypothetical protein